MARCKMSCPPPSITGMQAASPTAPFGRGQRQRLETLGVAAGRQSETRETPSGAMHGVSESGAPT